MKTVITTIGCLAVLAGYLLLDFVYTNVEMSMLDTMFIVLVAIIILLIGLAMLYPGYSKYNEEEDSTKKED